VTVFERLKVARKQRDKTQKDCARELGITDASYGRKEKGKEGGLGPEELARLATFLEVDARFLLGQIDSWERADLKNPERDQIDPRVIDAIDARLNPTNGDKELSKLMERLRIDAKLREHTLRLARQPGDIIEMVDAYARFLLAEKNEISERASDTA